MDSDEMFAQFTYLLVGNFWGDLTP